MATWADFNKIESESVTVTVAVQHRPSNRSRSCTRTRTRSHNDDYTAPLAPSAASDPRRSRRLPRIAGQRILEEKESKASEVSEPSEALPGSRRRKSSSRRKKSSSKSNIQPTSTNTSTSTSMSPSNSFNNSFSTSNSFNTSNSSNTNKSCNKTKGTKHQQFQIQTQMQTQMQMIQPQDGTIPWSGVMGTTVQFQETIQPEEDTISATTIENATSLSSEAQAQIDRLKDQLLALKVRNRGLDQDFEKLKATLKEEREAMRDLEEDHLDMKHDLAQTKRVSARLEKENRFLRKKVNNREAENNRLQARVDNLAGVTGDESNMELARMEYDELDDELPEELIPRETKPTRMERKRSSVWQLLAEETIPEEMQCPPSPSMESKGSILDNFFRSSSTTIASFADMSVLTGSSSQSRTDARQRSISSAPTGGTVPAA
jgi:chromosome segregation ATPase